MSVYKRKGQHRKPYQVKYRDGHGVRRSKQFRSKEEAKAFNIRTGSELRDGTHTADRASPTVRAAGDKWIAAAKADGLERTTLVQYEQHLRLHIIPFLGNTLLNKITVPALRAFEDRLRDEGRSAAMRRKVLVSLSSLLANAQENGEVARNVARDRKRTRRGRNQRISSDGRDRRGNRLKIGVDIPLPPEIKAIITAVAGRWRPLFLTAIFTGLRSSELRGLRWTDLDLDNRMLSVRQRADRWGVIGPPKSEASERTLPIPPIVANVLREWKLRCPKGEMNLVFPNRVGRPEDHANILRRGLHPLMIAAGICDKGKPRYSGLHCFRHWYASWCLNRREDGGLGLPYKTVQSRMGHSTLALTVDCYSHLFPERDEADTLAVGEAALLA